MNTMAAVTARSIGSVGGGSETPFLLETGASRMERTLDAQTKLRSGAVLTDASARWQAMDCATSTGEERNGGKQALQSGKNSFSREKLSRDTSRNSLMASGKCSIASSWSSTWDVRFSIAKRSTIRTEFETITRLRILSSGHQNTHQVSAWKTSCNTLAKYWNSMAISIEYVGSMVTWAISKRTENQE